MRIYMLFILICLMQLVAATGPHILVPHHRHFWDPSVPNHWYENCTDTPATVNLQDQELLQWTSANNTEGAAYVSVRIWPQDGKKIIDMEKFAYQLESATCTEAFSLHFQTVPSFRAAKSAWEVVNSDEQHSFFMVADTEKCAIEERIPWLITNATFDQAERRVNLQATKKEWAEVIQSYIIDLGNVDTASQKRAVLVDRAFEIPLDWTWPSELVKADNPFFKMKANCIDCGTKGSLVLAAHVEGEITKGLTQALFSATPRGIEGNIQVDVELDGQYNFVGTEDFGSGTFELGRIPIPIPLASYSVAGIFTFGPNVLIRAGYDFESIDAQGKISTGATARVPAGSILSAELISKAHQREGWIPEFETHPLECEAEINVQGRIWAGVAPSVSLLVFPGKKTGIINLEKGISLDLELRFFELSINATGGHDPAGFCANDPAPFGVNLDMWLGSSLTIAGWKTSSSGKDDLLNAVLFDNDKLYHLPPVCFSFGTGSPGPCHVFLEDEEDRLWWENEVANPVDVAPRKMGRMRRHQILPREYYLACDKKSKDWPINLKEYPSGPSLIKAGIQGSTIPPIMYPPVPCSEGDVLTCGPSQWIVEELELGVDKEEDKFLIDLINTKEWNAEHVYEGNWLRDFWNRLAENDYLKSCGEVNTFFAIREGGGYANEMLSSLGTTQTRQERMTLLPEKENQIKHWMFAEKNLDSRFMLAKDSSKLPNTAIKRACSLGRIVGVCKYMEAPKTKKSLVKTIQALHKVLDKMDKDLEITGKIPSGFKGFAKAHEIWFLDFYKKGTKNARNKLQEYAQWMMKEKRWSSTEYVALGKDLRDAIKELADGNLWEKYCPDTFEYPVKATTPDRPGTCPADTTSDPNNCGECGKKCPSDHFCTKSECTTPSSSNFPPPVTPADSAKSGWQLAVEAPSPYLANSWGLEKKFFLEYGGQLTVNTRCVGVNEPENEVLDAIAKDSLFNFGPPPLNSGEVADTCCIAFFRGTTCDVGAEKPQLVCETLKSAKIEFDARAWQVYGCAGLWVEQET